MKKTLTLIMMLIATMSVSAQEKNIKVVSSYNWTSGKTFEQALGPDKYEIDSLVVIDQTSVGDEEFRVIHDCCENGRLTGVDLSGASIAGLKIPAYAFYPSLVNGKPHKESENIDEEHGYRINLRYITLPNITKIENSAFALTNLETVEIPANASLENDAFGDCTHLKNVIIKGKAIRPDSEGYAFKGLADGAVLHVAPGNAGGYIGVKSWGAFSSIDETETAYIVKDINTDGKSPLADILGSSNMHVDSIKLSGTPTADDFECLLNNNIGGRLLGLDLSDCTTEDGYLYGCRLDYLRMPKKMQKICDAFLDFSNVKHLTMPENYDEIGFGAFSHYKWFADSTLNITEGCRKIGYKAFVDCHSIKTIVLPSTLEELEPASLGFIWGHSWLELEIDIYVNRMTPPYSPDTFNGMPVSVKGPFACPTQNWRLFVPMGAKKNYENAEHWDHFKTIIETPLLTGTSSGIDGTVAAPQNGMKEVYTTDGRLVAKGATLPQLPKGLYIIKENEKARKVFK